LSLLTKLSAPTLCPYRPKFLEKLCTSAISCPSSTKSRMAAASVGASPDAKPWYAQSKNGRCPFLFITSDTSFHWEGVGSMPVGLCAHACSRKQLPSGADSMSASRPEKFRPDELTS
jgi:hypothetical protein